MIGALDLFSSFFPLAAFRLHSFGFERFDIPGIAIVVPFILYELIISALAIIGGWHLQKGSSKNWAIAGAVACCLTSFWWPLGPVIGIFSLVLIFKNPGPLPSSTQPQATSPLAPVSVGPRLSILALAGALLQVLFVGTNILIFTLVIYNVDGGPLSFVMVLTILLLSIPGGIMGWIAANKIRNSGGQLYGMGAAITAALFPTALLVIGLLIFAIAGVLYLIRESGTAIEPDGTTVVISTFLIVVTALAILIQTLVSSFHHLRGTSLRSTKPHWIAALVFVVLWCILGALYWIQRPQQLDTWLTSHSEDEHHLAMGSTWYRIHIFDRDHLTFRFVVQGKGGVVLETKEIPVPIEKLAQDYRVAPHSEYLFGEKGIIRWETDSVEFSMNELKLLSLELKPY